MYFVVDAVVLHYPKGCLQMNLHSSVLFGGMLLEPVECGIMPKREFGLELGSRCDGKTKWCTLSQSTSGRSCRDIRKAAEGDEC